VLELPISRAKLATARPSCFEIQCKLIGNINLEPIYNSVLAHGRDETYPVHGLTLSMPSSWQGFVRLFKIFKI